MRKNRYDKFFIRWQKIFAEENSKQQRKKLKAINRKLNKTETYKEKLKK